MRRPLAHSDDACDRAPLSRPLPRVVLRFCQSGLLVQDSTHAVHKLLVSLGGRRDDVLDGWLFPFCSKPKVVIALRVGGFHDSYQVEDWAEVRLLLRTFRSGVLVTGQTLPVQHFLERQGGVWDHSLLAWYLEGFHTRQLRRMLWKCQAVEAIQEVD